MKPRNKKRKTRLHQAENSRLRRAQQARADLVKMGLLEDSGVRRDGGIVWRLTPKGIELTQQNPDLVAARKTRTKFQSDGPSRSKACRQPARPAY
jgi:predicted transcriptional regulator